MRSRMGAFGAPLLAVALAFLGGVTPSVSHAQADRTAPRAMSRGGFLGVRTQDLTDDLRDSYDFHGDGVLVSDVSADTPADRLGIHEGDIITRVGDRSVGSPRELADVVRSHDPGTLVSVTIWRDGRERSLGPVALGDAEDAPQMAAPRAPEPPEAPEAPGPPPARQHLRIPRHDADRDQVERNDKDDQGKDKDDAEKDDEDLPGMSGLRELRGMHDMPGMGNMMQMMGRGRLGVELGEDSDEGVAITRVLDDTPADRAGLKAGDRIVAFDGHRVTSGDDLRQMVREHAAGDVEVRIERRGQERTLTAHLGPRQGNMGMGDMGMGNMQWRRLPGGNGWEGRSEERGDDSGKDKGRVERRVYRYRVPSQDELDRAWQGLSPEDRAQLQRDIQQLRDDLQRMRRELREQRQKQGDEGRGDDRKDRDDSHDKGHDSDDDNSGN